MCGIFAAVMPKGHPACSFAARAASIMRHRGPDAQGVLHVELSWASVTLSMSRLKVVDQSDLDVPYDFRSNFGVVLAFNGEIYNWRDLRTELDSFAKDGAPGWKTRCDAEVVAAAWRRWGPGCLHRLNGMFAFVLVDTVSDAIFCARDRAGEKPFYSAQRGGVFYVASEPKALPVALEPGACPDAETLEFDCGRSTPFAGVNVLEPGWCMYWPRQGVIRDGGRSQWWQLPDAPEEPTRPSVDHQVDKLHALLMDASRIRHVAEVPVAVQLSGGLDSAIIQAVCQSEQLYCVTFPEVDNLSKAQLVARGYPVTPITFTRDELVDAIPEVVRHMDTPASWTSVCQWFMNQQVAADGNVVVLSGEGADELLGGYSRYRILYWVERMLNDARLSSYGPLIERTVGSREDVMGHMLDRGHDPQTRAHAMDLVEQHGGTGDLVERMARTDFYTTMQVLLRMADRMAAAFSLENRSPFFDYRVMEFAARLPSRYKVTGFESKAILRRIAERLGVDERVVNEKTKKGLYVPSNWGDGGLVWDRKWFARLMNDAWEQHCCRSALCEECET